MKQLKKTILIVVALLFVNPVIISQIDNTNRTIADSINEDVVIIRVQELNMFLYSSGRAFEIYIVSPESPNETIKKVYNDKRNDPKGDLLVILSKEINYWKQKGYKIESSTVFPSKMFGGSASVEYNAVMTTIILTK